jgi:hypothetical protein
MVQVFSVSSGPWVTRGGALGHGTAFHDPVCHTVTIASHVLLRALP